MVECRSVNPEDTGSISGLGSGTSEILFVLIFPAYKSDRVYREYLVTGAWLRYQCYTPGTLKIQAVYSK